MAERVRDRVRGFDVNAFGIFTRSLQLSLIDGNLARAHHLVDLFADQFRDSKKKAKLEPGDPVSLLVDPETSGLLEAAGYANIASVFAATDAELRKIKYVGTKRLTLIREALKKNGFTRKSTKTAILSVL